MAEDRFVLKDATGRFFAGMTLDGPIWSDTPLAMPHERAIRTVHNLRFWRASGGVVVLPEHERDD